MQGLRGHEGDGVDGEMDVEEEEEGRTEQEKLHFGGGDCGDDSYPSTSAPALVTNPLLLEALLPTAPSVHGPLELINCSSELTSLGKITALSV